MDDNTLGFITVNACALTPNFYLVRRIDKKEVGSCLESFPQRTDAKLENLRVDKIAVAKLYI